MGIATRLWLAFMVAVTCVLGLGFALRVAEEERLLLEVTLRDRRFFAEALHASLSREHGTLDPLAEARQMLDREEVAAAHIVAKLVSEDAGTTLPRPMLDAANLTVLRRGDVVVTVVGDEILTYVPLERGDRAVALELREPHALNAIVSRIGLRALVVQASALAILGGLATYLAVGVLLSRPLRRLSTFAHRIAGGDLEHRVPVEPDDGDEVSMLAIDMNQMAGSLAAVRRALEEVEAERAEALERLRHADRLRTVGELASALAHELGTPLNVVSGHARSIEDDPESPPEVSQSAREIREQARRMTRILRDLLDFSRRRGRRGHYGLLELVRRAVETISPLARKHRVDVTVRGDATLSVRADAQQLEQVVVNLVTNAMQAMPDGGLVEIEVGRHEASPPEGVPTQAGSFAFVHVRDRGAGIDEEDLPHLFEPFFTRKEAGEGTGLGLAVVDGIVREHGGFVTVESRKGVGTMFAVNLPLFARPGSEPPPSA